MHELLYPLCDFVQVKTVESMDRGWPTPSPFNLRFTSRRLTYDQSTAIAGSGLYMISRGDEVVYVGLYRPINGNIIADRWGRHLQTITARGYNIGLGGRDPGARRDELLNAVSAEGLRQAIGYAYSYSQSSRYRDTGYNTTPNRLRFASENWETFSQVQGNAVLRSLSFWLLRIRTTPIPSRPAEDVRMIERTVLGKFKPVCNSEYDHRTHADHRTHNSVLAVTNAIRQAAIDQTGEDITHRIQLAGA